MRFLSAREFAAVSIAWIGSAVATNAQRVVVSEQVVVASRSNDREDLHAVGPSSGFLFGGVLFVGCLVGLVWTVGAWLALGVATFVACNLYYDAVRYRAIYQDKIAALLRADIGVTVGAVTIAMGSLYVGSTGAFIAGFIVCTLLGTASLGGACRPSVGPVVKFVRQVGSYAGWSMFQATLINFVAQGVVLLAVPLVSVSEFAHIRAVQNAASPLATLVRAVEPKLVTFWSGRVAAGVAVGRTLAIWLILVTPIAVAVTAAVSSTATFWAPFVLGSQYADVGRYVAPIVGATLFAYVGAPGGVLLRVLRVGKPNVVAQLAAVVGASCVMLVLPRLWAGAGAAWAIGVQALFSVTFAYFIVFRRASARVHP